MLGMNQYFTNEICEWLIKFINKTDFYDLLPIFEGKSKDLTNKKKDYGKIFSKVLPPPKNIISNKKNNHNESQLLHFIQFLFSSNYRNNIFSYFLHFLPNDQMTFFLSKNIRLSTIPENDLNLILPQLPFCDYIVLIHCQRLQFQNTFLISVAFIFRYYEQLTPEIEQIVTKSFRQALQKGVGSNLLHEMLSILFAMEESGSKKFNFFFLAIQESAQILLNYIKKCNLTELFSSFPQRDDLPLSFLNFLINTTTFYYLTESLIIQYSIKYSELFFRYISQISDEFELNRIWRFLLNSIDIISSFQRASIAYANRKKSDSIRSGWKYVLNLSNSMRIHIVHNILNAYLFFIERYQSLSLLCNERSFKTWMLSFISLNFEKICVLDNYLAVMVNIFLIARSNEMIAVLISDNLSMNDYFLRILSSSFDSEKLRFNTKIVRALLFILFPFGQYIFNGIFPQASNFLIVSFNSSPCNTFCKGISSSILSILLNIKVPNDIIQNCEETVIFQHIFDDIVTYLVEMSNHIQFQKVCSFLFDQEEFLMKIARLALSEKGEIVNEAYYSFVISCLSHSCNFAVFYYIYSCIEKDISKTINFLRRISERAPLVNTFIYPTEPLEIKMPLYQMTTVLWFRIMNNAVQTSENDEKVTSILSHFPTKVLSIQVLNPTENTCTLMLNREMLYVIDEKMNKIAGKINFTSNIENWNLLTISINSKSIDLSFNLQQTSIRFSSNISNADYMVVHPCFDIQLLRIYKNPLKWSQILHIFAIGPNSKDYLIDDFTPISCNLPTVINPSSPNNYSTYFNASSNNGLHLFSNRGYISTLYINFHELFDSDDDQFLSSFSSTIHFSVSPPYEIIKSGREKVEIDKKIVWSFNSFFTSLDAIGGINLIIHLVSEVLVKYPKYHDETLVFLSILLNRFPFIHDFFTEHSIYDLLACLVDSHLNFQSLFLYDNKLITNSKIIQCFLSKNRPSQTVIQNIVRSFNYSSGIHNNKFLNTTQLYNMIIMTLNDFNDVKMIEMLCEFALKLTVKDNFNEHSTFAFVCLLHNHFNYDNVIVDDSVSELSKNNDSTIHLIRLCNKLLPNQSIHVEALIPLLLNNNLTDDIKFELLGLLLDNTSIDFYDYLSFAIQNMTCDVKKMFEYATTLSPLLVTFLFPFFMNRATKENENIGLSPSNKLLETLCNKFSSINNQFSIELLHQYFLLVQCSCSPLFFLSSKKRENKSILMYIAVFIVRSYESNQEETNKLIINFFYLLQYIQFEKEKEKSANDVNDDDKETYSKSITFSILATLFFSLRSSNYPTNSAGIISFGLNFGEFLLSQICHFSIYANFFVKEMFKFVLKTYLADENNAQTSSHEFQSVIPQLSKFLSFLTSKPRFVFNEKMMKLILTVEELTKKKRRNAFMNMFFSSHSSDSSQDQLNSPFPQKTKTFIFQRNKYYVKNLIESLPSKVSIDKTRFSGAEKVDHFQSDEINGYELKKWDWEDFLECCLIYYRSLKSDVIDRYFEEEELNEKIIETLKNVFYSLQIPSSHIYDSCPKKYTISDSSNKIEIRRLLFPMNPSFDSCFLSYWDTKYQTDQPEIRLSLNELIRPNMFSISQNTANGQIFKASWLYRISMIKGFIVVTDQRIKFYQKKLSEVGITFSIDDIKSIRIISNQHEKKGILIEDNLYRNYSFAFKSETECDTFLDLVSNRIKITETFELEKYLIEKQKKWLSNEISNFEYLIYLNRFSGRTWCDFTQYPFFPWVLTKYDSLGQFDLHNPSIYRDLSYQLFAQTEAHRKCCNEYYEVTTEMNQVGSHFPNYVSNIGSTIYYLVRLEPFVSEEIMFQSGKYDSPDRMFQSFEVTSQIMIGINTKSSLEFVPEVYYLPEMYKNINQLVFPKSNLDETLNLDEFCLPSWAKSAEDLVYKLRKALESPYVSAHLHEWINLIWGVKRTGELALKCTNVFPDHVFRFDKEAYKDDKILIRGMLSEIHNCGTAPEQLFFEAHPQRFVPVISRPSFDSSNSKEGPNVTQKSGKNITSTKSLSSLFNSGANIDLKATKDHVDGDDSADKAALQNSPQNAKSLNDHSSRSNFDINSRFSFFEQRESRLQFTDIRLPMAKESYSLKFDKDWLVIPPVHKIRISRQGVLEIVRRNSIAPAQKYRFGKNLRPVHVYKSGSEIVTAHRTPIVVHWCISSASNNNNRISSSSSTSNMTKSATKVSSSPSVLANLSSSSSFNLSLSAASSSALSNSSKKSGLAINNSSAVSPSANASKSGKKVTIETDSYSANNGGETCLKMVNVLRGYPVNITTVFISTTSFVILAGHEDGCVSVFSISPHRFLRVIEIESIEKKRLKYAVTMVRTSNWNSDIIVFQQKNWEENDKNNQIITAKPTDKIEPDTKNKVNESSSMMNKLMNTVKSKFQRQSIKASEIGIKPTKSTSDINHDATSYDKNNDNDDVDVDTDAGETVNGGFLTVVSLYSVNGVFHRRIWLNHKIIECCGTSYPYATKKNYFALLTSDAKIILLNGRNLKVVQVYDISMCPPAVSIIYNKMNDTLILTTVTKEVIDFNLTTVTSQQ